MKYLEWFGTIVSVLGSFIVAMHFMAVGYILFIFGSVSWLFVAVVKKNKALATLNGFFLAANFLGLFNSL